MISSSSSVARSSIRQRGSGEQPVCFLEVIAQPLGDRSATILGLSERSPVTELSEYLRHVAGAIVGSALVGGIENGDSPSTFLNSLLGKRK